jgi:hypothetical protein
MSSAGPGEGGAAQPHESGTWPPPEEAPRGQGFVGPFWLILLIVLLVFAAVLLLYAIWAFWPSEGQTSNSVARHKTVHFLWHRRELSRESLFFVMVALTGALGAMVHVIRSLSWYVGNRLLKWSWVPFYLLKPVLGAAMATLLYFIVRAGFFSPSASTSQTSPYGFAAVSALAGLFTDQAIEKLRAVAEELFQQAPQGKDAVAAEPTVTIAPPTTVTSTSALLVGAVNPKGRETAYQFEWGETTDYGNRIPAEPESVGAALAEKPVSVTLTGLEPGREYHYRLVATSEGGMTQSPDQTFRTPES